MGIYLFVPTLLLYFCTSFFLGGGGGGGGGGASGGAAAQFILILLTSNGTFLTNEEVRCVMGYQSFSAPDYGIDLGWVVCCSHALGLKYFPKFMFMAFISFWDIFKFKKNNFYLQVRPKFLCRMLLRYT